MEKKIKVIESTRFRFKSVFYKNTIYLPYSLPDLNFIKSELLIVLNKIKMSSLTVKLHPRFINSKNHLHYNQFFERSN